MLYFLERVIFSEREFPARLGKGNWKPSLGSLVRKWEGEHLFLGKVPPSLCIPIGNFSSVVIITLLFLADCLISRSKININISFVFCRGLLPLRLEKCNSAASVERIKCFLSSILIKMWESLRGLCKVLKKTMQKVYAKIGKKHSATV